MADSKVLASLHAISTALVMVDPRSDRDEWMDVLRMSEALQAALAQAEADEDASVLAEQMTDILRRLADGQFASPAGALGVVNQLARALQGLESPAGIDAAARKQAMAQAGLLNRDADLAASQDTGNLEDDEQRELVIEIEKRLDELEQTLFGIAGGERNPETVRGVFREFHTLKGESAIIGLKEVADFWHEVESQIEAARRGELVLTDDLLESLRDSVGLGRRLLQGECREDIGEERLAAFVSLLAEAAEGAKRAAAEAGDAPPAEESFDDFFDGVALPPVPGADGEEAESAGGEAETVSEPEDEPSGGLAPLDTGDLSALMADDADDGDILIPAALNGDRGRNGGGMGTPAGGLPSVEETQALTPEDVDDPFGVCPARKRAGGETVVLAPAMNALETMELSTVPVPGGMRKRVVDTQAFVAQVVNEERKSEDGMVLKAIPIDVHKLDQLLELVNQVSLTSTHLSEHPLVASNPDMADRVMSVARSGRQLYGMAAGLRMTAIKPLFMTLRRAALDAARASRKLINVNLEGVDTQVDRSVIEGLSTALVHVVRNAVDHGIEAAEIRRAAGKPERGRISAVAKRAGADVIVEFSDDGRGYNLEAIRKKAANMGLIQPDAVLSDQETAELVFLPGLSTAQKVTGLSGRGVGMEIVKKAIDALKGRVEIETKQGQGTTLRLRLPVALAALEGLVVRVGRNTLVFPVFVVRECFRVRSDQISTVQGGGTVVSIRGVVVPVLFLDREFGMRSDAERIEDGVLALLEEGDSLCAVLVDEALEARQVLIRPVESSLGHLDLVSGMALLPDRSIALVVDVRKLIERVGVASAKAFSEAGHRQAAAEREIDTVSIGSNQVGMIDFAVNAPDGRGGMKESVFAINAFKTREFVPAQDIKPLPNMPNGLLGVQLLRGEAVPIVHLGIMCGVISEHERRPEWDNIILLCEFAGRTVGFMVSHVNRVSYISWGDIMPPPESGGLFKMDYVVGTILVSRLGHSQRQDRRDAGAQDGDASQVRGLSREEAENARPDVAFVLDFERIVGNVIRLYGDMGADLENFGETRKEGVTMLLVEDSPLIRRQSVKALEGAGIKVIQAGDGQEAWDKLLEIQEAAEKAGDALFAHIDLVMSDIEMPRMDGYTLTQQIKKHPKLRVLPVLLHSSITNDMMIQRAKEVEADGFVPKCDPKELSEQLKKYL